MLRLGSAGVRHPAPVPAPEGRPRRPAETARRATSGPPRSDAVPPRSAPSARRAAPPPPRSGRACRSMTRTSPPPTSLPRSMRVTPNSRSPAEHPARQLAVARLEDVQRQHRRREQHRLQRKHRAASSRLRRPAPEPPGPPDGRRASRRRGRRAARATSSRGSLTRMANTSASSRSSRAYPLRATTPSSDPVLAATRPAAVVPTKRPAQRAALRGDRQAPVGARVRRLRGRAARRVRRTSPGSTRSSPEPSASVMVAGRRARAHRTARRG